MPTARANGATLYYEQQGEGADLVLIMGLGAHLGAWALQLPAFARHFRVTAFDNRGVGRSDAPDEPYSIAGMAEDAAALMSAIGIGRAHVVGVSMGGMIAQELAIRAPERVDRLVIACSRARAHETRRIVAPAQAALYDLELDPAARMLLQMPWSYTSAFMSEPHRVEAALAVARQNPYPTLAHAYRRQQDAVLAHDTLDRLDRITAPTLVLVGAEDILTPVAESVELARRIPGAELRVLPRGGHGFAAEYAADFNRAVLEFLSGGREPRSGDR